MSNPLLLFWYRLFATEPVRRAPRWRVPMSHLQEGLGHDLFGHAPDAGAADRPDRDLRNQHPGSHADPRPGCGGPPVAHGLLRRLLRHELHRLDDRLRRDPVPVHLQPADVVDDLDLPHGGGLGVRDRVASGPAAGTRLPAGAGPAALHAQGRAAARTVPADRRLRAHRRAARPARWMRWAGASW